MSISRTFTTTIADNTGATSATDRTTVSANSEEEFSVAAAASGNTTLVIAVDISACQGFYITTDKACTIKTNNASPGDDSIALTAGQVFHWHAVTGGPAIPLTADITSLIVVNGAGAVANVSGAFLQNV
jgi:hypothetical protein